MITKKIQNAKRRVVKIKKDLQSLGEMKPGTLSEQYNVCGQVGCKCKDKKNRKNMAHITSLVTLMVGKAKLNL